MQRIGGVFCVMLNTRQAVVTTKRFIVHAAMPNIIYEVGTEYGRQTAKEH